MMWTVEIQTASPEDATDDGRSLWACLELLRPHDSDGSCDRDGWDLSLQVTAEDMREAWNVAMGLVYSAAAASDLPLWRVVRVSVMDSEYAAAGG
jgi:hypothetical protein